MGGGVSSDEEEENVEKFVTEKNFAKLKSACMTEGFREGVGQGNEEALQAGFDTGYKSAFCISRFFSRYRGLVAVKQLIVAKDSEEYGALESLQNDIDRIEEEAFQNARNQLRSDGKSDEFDLEEFVQERLDPKMNQLLKSC